MYGPCLNSDAKLKKKVRYTYNKENTGKSVNLRNYCEVWGDHDLVLIFVVVFIFKSPYRKMWNCLQEKYCDV